MKRIRFDTNSFPWIKMDDPALFRPPTDGPLRQRRPGTGCNQTIPAFEGLLYLFEAPTIRTAPDRTIGVKPPDSVPSGVRAV